jgi:tRNA(Ile)-lysidine synthase TilS/MesJ
MTTGLLLAARFRAATHALGLTPSTPVAVALSGGVDSMALCFLAAGLFERVVAITIDHKLRPESSAEAAQVRISVQALATCGGLLRMQSVKRLRLTGERR